MSKYGWAVLCVAGGVAAGCGDKVGGSAASCGGSAACPPGEGCVLGVCAELCNDDTDCEANQACVSGFCQDVDGDCDNSSQCRSPAPCENADAARCVGGTCQYDALVDRQACVLPTSEPGLCLGGACVECELADDCLDWVTTYPQCVTKSCESGVCTYQPRGAFVCVAEGCDPALNQLSGERICGSDINDICPPVGNEIPCPDGFACAADGQTCRTDCDSNSECAANYYCGTNHLCAPQLTDGAPCAGLSSDACLSGYCNGVLCCSGGDCCNAAAECPPTYSAPSQCDTAGGVTCNGQRRDAQCVDHVCTTAIVDDDSGCQSFARACGVYASQPCSSEVEQVEPTCPTSCPTPGDPTGCAPGNSCTDEQVCVVPEGAGSLCAGVANCLAGLECENGVCCATNAAALCCNDATDCPDNRACDLATFTCRQTCSQPSDCAEGYVCFLEDCIDGYPDGVGCASGDDCASGVCHLDRDGVGQFCATDSTTCVFDNGTTVAQRPSGYEECGGTDTYQRCNSNGTWSGSTTCSALSCNTQGAVTCGVVVDAANVCTSGGGGGCTSEIGAPTCTDCGPYVSSSGVCGSGVGACATLCGAACIQGETGLVASYYCSGTSSYQRLNGCGSDCSLSVDDGGANDVPTVCGSGCNSGSGQCNNCASCGAYVCDLGVGSCYTSCASNDDAKCAGGYHCYSGNNQCYTNANGQACDGNGECASGNCAANLCAQDTTPDAFAFTDLTGQALSALLTSNIVQITGVSGSVTTSVSGSGEYRICGDATCASSPAFGSGASTLSSGQYVQLRVTSSAAFATAVSTTLTVGSSSDVWSVTTRAANNCTSTPWGTVNHGNGVTAYLNATEPYGGSCTSQTRSCSDGTLSGTYTNTSCSVTPGANCTGTPWGTVNHGSGVTAYLNATEPYGGSCASQTRTCTNGSLSGTYANTSCSVNSPANCTLPWGATLVHGNTAAGKKYTAGSPYWDTNYITCCGTYPGECEGAQGYQWYPAPTCDLAHLGWYGNASFYSNLCGSGINGYFLYPCTAGASTCSGETFGCNNGSLSGDTSFNTAGGCP